MARLDGRVCLITGAVGGPRPRRRGALRPGGRAGRRRRPGRWVRGRRGSAPAVARPATCTATSTDDALGQRRGGPHGGDLRRAARALQQRGGVAGRRRRARGHPDEVWETTLRVNVTGLACAASTASRAMLDSGGGSIINVASFVAHLGAATPQIAYTASKGAVLAMTREIAVHVRTQRHPRERPLPRPRAHSAARQVPGGRRGARAPPGARPDGPLRRGRSRSRTAPCSWRRTSRRS